MKRARRTLPMRGTWQEFIRTLWPGVSDDVAHSLLWCCSAFPACNASHACRQLRQAARRDRSPLRAITRAHENLDTAMAKFRAKEAKRFGDRP